MKKKTELNLKLNKRKVSELSVDKQSKIQGGYGSMGCTYWCTQAGNTCWNFTCNSFYCSITGC